MTFKDLAQKLKNTYMTLPSVVNVLSDGFAQMEECEISADKVSFDKTGTSLSSENVEGAIKEINSAIVKTSTEITGSPSVNINVPSSGDYIGYIYITPYTSTGIQTGGGAYMIKNYNGRVHLTEIKQLGEVSVSAITVNEGSVTVTFGSDLSSFVQAVVFKL